MSSPSLSIPPRVKTGLLLVVGVATAISLWLAIDNRFYIYPADVKIEGAVRVSPEELFRASGVGGEHVLWVKDSAVEERILSQISAVEDVQVKCRLPGQCSIVIEERKPEILWDEDGKLWWIDDEGIVFEAHQMITGEWMVRGPLPRDEEDQLEEDVRTALLGLWSSGAEISQVLEYDPTRGLIVTDKRGWRVFIGNGPGMTRRLHTLELLAEDLQARGVTPQYVDVRYPEAPTYSLTGDW